MTPDIIAALEAFAAYADPRRSVPASMPITNGSSMARKQLTMGDCYAAADALAALSTSPAGQEAVCDLCNGSGKNTASQIWPDYPPPCRVCGGTGNIAPSVEPAGNVGLDLSAIGSGHCYCWCHPNAGAIGCSPCCDAEDNYLPPSKRDPALSSVEPAGNGREGNGS